MGVIKDGKPYGRQDRPRWALGLCAWVCRPCRYVIPPGQGDRCPRCGNTTEVSTIFNLPRDDARRHAERIR